MDAQRSEYHSTQYVNEKEVSRVTGLAVQTLRNYRHLGKGPAYCKVGRAIRYRMEDVVNFMDEQRVEPRE